MPNWFNRKLTLPKVKHSVNDMSNDFKTSFKIGQLMPVYLEECLPSDKFLNLKTDSLIRFAPLYTALLHRVQVHSNTFFTPVRIILGDDVYEKFLNGLRILPIKLYKDLESSSIVEGYNPFENYITDYIGIDPNQMYFSDTVRQGYRRYFIDILNPFPIFSYFLIVRDWYLDSNIESDKIQDIDDYLQQYRDTMIDDTTSHIQYNIDTDMWAGLLTGDGTFQCAVTKDYFSTARPTPEKGTEMYVLNRPLGLSPSDSQARTLSLLPNGIASYYNGTSDVSVNETTTIRDLWRKEMMQQYFQIDNKFGTRIREKLAGHFGVEISDKRIMIPRFVGGSSSSVNISEVIQTSSTVTGVDASPQGNLAGKASSFSSGRKMSYFCEEHGYMMTVLSLIPDNGYCNGSPRTFWKSNIFDFASPEFNNIGWQPVLKGELFGDSDYVKNFQEWGYQPRYCEYRSHPSRCAGVFRTSEYLRWHLNRSFAECPPLNSQFLRVPSSGRVFNFASDDYPNLPYCFIDAYTTSVMSRPISAEPDSIHLY